jgi:hypothetical protein
MTSRWTRTVTLLAATLLTALGVTWSSAIPVSASVNTTLVNFNNAGQPVVRFDTAGNAVDAHDGMLADFGGTYYLYGTSYDCGYRWQVNSGFCGFKVYSSPDLVHWTDRGYVVPSYSCGLCFRPHVLYDPATAKYVLWTNDGNVQGDFRVYTSSTPTGPFTQQNLPHLAYSDCGWDFGLYSDPGGRAYMVNTDCPDGAKGLVVQRLTADDLSTDGTYTVIHTPMNTEAPDMFRRGSEYYITMSDPTCGYCSSTGTGYLTATSPLGPWTGASQTDPWTIQNGQLHAAGGEIGLAATGSGWTDYSFAVDVSPLQTATQNGISYAQAGLTARMNSAYSGYGFLLSNYPYTSPAAAGYLAFVKFSNGNPVSVQPVALPFAVTGGTSYHVITTVSGSTITVSINGTVIDTVTDSSYPAGTVGFREFGNTSESADFGNVRVTAPDGTVLLSDDFSGDLSKWNFPPATITPYLVSGNSCGGQPSFEAELPRLGGGTAYLYASDLWDNQYNEGLASYFWAPLQFGSDGSIQQISCSAAATVALADGHPGQQLPVTGLDQTSASPANGSTGFTTSCPIMAGTEELQTFTAGRTGTLSQVRLTAFQDVPGSFSTAPPPNQPLNVQLVTLNASGGIATVLAQQVFDPNVVGWSPRDLVMTPGVKVQRGTSYGIVASSATTSGCFGVASNAANPYPAGQAAVSTDSGQTFTAQPGTDLKFLTVVSR